VDRPLRVLLLEDSAADAEKAIDELVRAEMSFEHVRVANRDDFVIAIARFEPDIVLSDHSMTQFNSVAALETLRDMRVATPLIVLSAGLDEHAAVDCMRAGAEDLVLKAHLTRLPAAIAAALRAHHEVEKLSPRQLQVLRLIAEGHSSPEIALRLRVTESTVETHRNETMKRLGAHDVAHLVRLAIRAGVIPQTK